MIRPVRKFVSFRNPPKTGIMIKTVKTMKRNSIFLFAATTLLTAALLAVSCGKENAPDTPDEPEAVTDYLGRLECVFQGETWPTENVAVRCDYDAVAGKVNLYLYAVRFVPQMPVTLDILVPEVPATADGETVTFRGDDIIPLMVGTGGAVTPVETYRVSGLSGTFDGTSAAFSLHFGPYPTSYTGNRVE